MDFILNNPDALVKRAQLNILPPGLFLRSKNRMKVTQPQGKVTKDY
jgi:hypothetical protein